MRKSNSTILLRKSFNTAEMVKGIDKLQPKKSGEKETFYMKVPNKKSYNFYISLKVKDEINRESKISNVILISYNRQEPTPNNAKILSSQKELLFYINLLSSFLFTRFLMR